MKNACIQKRRIWHANRNNNFFRYIKIDTIQLRNLIKFAAASITIFIRVREFFSLTGSNILYIIHSARTKHLALNETYVTVYRRHFEGNNEQTVRVKALFLSRQLVHHRVAFFLQVSLLRGAITSEHLPSHCGIFVHKVAVHLINYRPHRIRRFIVAKSRTLAG